MLFSTITNNAASRMVLRRLGSSSKCLIRRSLSAKTGGQTTTFLVVNSLGTDRVGIVSELSNLIASADGSISESSACKVGSFFSLTMSIRVPTNAAESVKAALVNMEGMHTHCMEITNDPQAIAVKPTLAYSGRFSLDGADNPGLVHGVTSILTKYNLSIDKMNTNEFPAPYGGTTLFHIDGVCTAIAPLPKSFNTDIIREELEEFGDSINCDVDLQDDTTE